jgi:hypothetical protein
LAVLLYWTYVDAIRDQTVPDFSDLPCKEYRRTPKNRGILWDKNDGIGGLIELERNAIRARLLGEFAQAKLFGIPRNR